jgi:hypothetical protein
MASRVSGRVLVENYPHLVVKAIKIGAKRRARDSRRTRYRNFGKPPPIRENFR